MNLNIVENCQWLKQEVITNWKTGVVMVSVAVVVGNVYGKVAVGFVLLFTVCSYDMIAQPIRTITWLGFSNSLIAIAILGGCHFDIINSKGTTVIAVIWALMKVSRLISINEDATSINQDISAQKDTLESNNGELKETYESLKAELAEELEKLHKAVIELKTAQDKNTEKIETVSKAIPETIQDLPSRVRELRAELEELRTPEMQELMQYKEKLRREVKAISQVIQTFSDEFGPLTEKVDKLGANLEQTVSHLELNVVLTGQQIIAMKGVLLADKH